MANDSRSRFTDNPFRDPNLPPERKEYLDRRNTAYRHWQDTGDPEPMREFGFDLPDRRDNPRPNEAHRFQAGQS